MSRHSRDLARWLLAFAALLALGCGPDFEPVQRLTKLRVLALRNEPVNPHAGETTTYDALVFLPPGKSDAPTYAWSWCPLVGEANAGYTCPLTDAAVQEASAALGVSGVPPLALGVSPTQTFTNPFPAAVLQNLCATGIDGTPVDCAGGFPVRVSLTVTQEGEQRAATTILRLPLADDAPSNANPTFDPGETPLVAALAGGDVPIANPPVASLPRTVETKVRANLSDAAVESYAGVDDEGAPTSARETLLLDWYIDAGDVSVFQTGYIPGQTQLSELVENRWKPSSKASYAADQAELIVVLRDNRGGVAWASGAVILEPTP